MSLRLFPGPSGPWVPVLGQRDALSENAGLHLGRSCSLLDAPRSRGSAGRSRHPWGGGKAGAARGGARGGLILHHELELRGSLQMPKSLLVMTPTMVLSTSQVKPLSQGQL